MQLYARNCVDITSLPTFSSNSDGTVENDPFASKGNIILKEYLFSSPPHQPKEKKTELGQQHMVGWFSLKTASMTPTRIR